ncbi:MAG TPA: hypothetical protein PKV73_00180 [Agriterribacter sp.]|nr:hypothetical protein [Chitinophagaceae bacterium]HRP30268.1 hypothetical protein [Agriterribacter sp.]
MLKYINSPLKATGSLLMLAGISIAVFTYQQFFFLGMSVTCLGVLLHFTAGLFFKSSNKRLSGKLHELLLVLFLFSFFLVLLLDYLGFIKLTL